MDVYVSATKEAAGSGGALLAKYAWWKQFNPDGSFDDMAKGEAMGLKQVDIVGCAFPDIKDSTTAASRIKKG